MFRLGPLKQEQSRLRGLSLSVITGFIIKYFVFFFSSRRRHTRFDCDWSSDVCSSDLGPWGELGHGPGQFSIPHSIAADSKGRLYVADRNNVRVQVFDQKGKYLEEWQIGRASCRERV